MTVMTPCLRWKCLDNFAKTKKTKLFYNSDLTISERSKVVLEPIFQKIKDECAKEIFKAFSEKNTHLTISGGNYTFFFILSNIFKWIKNVNKLLPVHIELSEIRSSSDLEKSSADIILSGYYDPQKLEDNFDNFEATGYSLARRVFFEEAFMMIAKNSLQDYENNTLDEQNILYGRIIGKNDSSEYKFAPSRKELALPRLVVDSYFMSYLFMLNGCGIEYGFSSMKYGKNLVKLDDHPIIGIKRLIFVKNDKKQYAYLKNTVFDCFDKKMGV